MKPMPMVSVLIDVADGEVVLAYGGHPPCVLHLPPALAREVSRQLWLKAKQAEQQSCPAPATSG